MTSLYSYTFFDSRVFYLHTIWEKRFLDTLKMIFDCHFKNNDTHTYKNWLFWKRMIIVLDLGRTFSFLFHWNYHYPWWSSIGLMCYHERFFCESLIAYKNFTIYCKYMLTDYLCPRNCNENSNQRRMIHVISHVFLI